MQRIEFDRLAGAIAGSSIVSRSSECVAIDHMIAFWTLMKTSSNFQFRVYPQTFFGHHRPLLKTIPEVSAHRNWKFEEVFIIGQNSIMWSITSDDRDTILLPVMAPRQSIKSYSLHRRSKVERSESNGPKLKRLEKGSYSWWGKTGRPTRPQPTHDQNESKSTSK